MPVALLLGMTFVGDGASGRPRASADVGRPAPTLHGPSRLAETAAIDSSGSSDPSAAPGFAGSVPTASTPSFGRSRSQSIGRASNGRLLHGVRITETAYLELKRGSRRAHFGTEELVGLLDHAARTVAETFPGSLLAVGDLSRDGGGRLRPHRSHRTGRDADLGFYLTDASGNSTHPGRFIRVHADSEADPYLFDADRNWVFLRALLEYPGANVQYVFVSPGLIPLMLEAGRRAGADEELLARAAEVMSHRARGHDTHFHVRIHCPADDRQCDDMERRRRRRSRPSRHAAPQEPIEI